MTAAAKKPVLEQPAATMAVLYLRLKRRKGQPVEAAGVSNSVVGALALSAEVARRRKVPQSWVEIVWYRKAKGQVFA